MGQKVRKLTNQVFDFRSQQITRGCVNWCNATAGRPPFCGSDSTGLRRGPGTGGLAEVYSRRRPGLEVLGIRSGVFLRLSIVSSAGFEPIANESRRVPAGDDLDEEQEEVEEEQDEEEADEEEGEEIEEDEEIEDKNMHGHARPTQTDQHETQPEPPNLSTRVNECTAKQKNKDIKIVFQGGRLLDFNCNRIFCQEINGFSLRKSEKREKSVCEIQRCRIGSQKKPEYNWLEEVIPTSLPLGTLLRDPTIPSSSTAVTNRLPTEALAQSSDLSSKPPSQALLTGSSNTYSFEPDSLANPELPSVAHDGMDLDDQDELDEEI
ncbi:hypothetical protein PCASD_20487 [Puccinia coronata f. sp. avenae]|uniref:Uncharacterized protein n=1 Tax=Puccinia coronata f. sp. avenae TaxID=200324 RepID=A0A2N5SJQ7_9BASI|nr:hypothetical protein PCASD_20487 [Puccinia coronata f. sp. avenae]